MNTFTIVWGCLLLVFLAVEAACPIHLISLWFAAGSLGAIVVNWLGGPFWLQVTVFVLLSGVLLLSLWPFTRKYLNPGHVATNVDSVLGMEGYVTAAIDNVHGQGQVMLGGMEWTARSTDGAPIAEGTLIRVDRIEGVKVFVTPARVTV